MKRLLAIFLAITMIAAFIPAVSAAGEEMAPQNFTIKYDLATPMTTLDVSGNGVQDDFINVFSEASTNGFYTFLSANRGAGDGGNNANWLSYQQNMWIRITARAGEANGDKDEGNISFNLTVPVSGTYTMSANVNKNWNGVTQIKYSKDKGATWTDFGTLTGGSLTADYDVMNGEEKASVYIDANENFAIGFFGTNDSVHSSFGDFYLKSGDGSGFAIVNGKIDAPETVKEGSPVTVTASGYNSKTAEAITSWTYSTEDTDVVTVNAETGLVEAVAPGTATITASAGAANVLTTTITVPDPNAITIKYDLATPMTTLDVNGNGVQDDFINVFSEANTNGFYTFLSAGRVAGDGGNNANWLAYQQNKWIRITNRGDGVQRSDISFNLTVPVSGTYTMSANVNASMNGITIVKYKKGNAEWTELGTLTGGSTTADYDVMNGQQKASVYIDANEDFAIGFFGTTDGVQSSFGDFYLKSGDGSGFAIVNGKIDAPETVKEGSPVTITASGYNSKTTEAITSWTYSTEDTDVITVEGNTVKAVAPGTATIIAKAEGAINSISKNITVPDPNAVKIKYDIGGDLYKLEKQDSYLDSAKQTTLHNSAHVIEQLTYDATNNFYAFKGSSVLGSTSTTDNNFICAVIQDETDKTANIRVSTEGRYVAFEVYVPIAGTYKMNMWRAANDYGTKCTNVYLNTPANWDAATTAFGEKIGSYSSYDANQTYTSDYFRDVESEPAEVSGSIVIPQPGNYVFTFEAVGDDGNPTSGSSARRYGSVGSFELIQGSGNLTVPMSAGVSVNKGGTEIINELRRGETATASANGYLSDGSVNEDAEASALSSSDSSVLKVENGNITAVAAGTAKLLATVDGKEVYRTITVTDEAVSGTASFVVASDVDGAVTVDATGYDPSLPVNSLNIGTKVTLTANTSDENYIFRGWKRGSADKGVWISSAPELSFTFVGHTMFTAIYDVAEAAEDEISVEFYNGNGQFVDSIDATNKTFSDIEPETAPTLTGFAFDFWAMEKEGDEAVTIDPQQTFEKLTRVVAQYKDKDDTFTVNGTQGYKYDDEITLNSNNGEVTWYIDGQAVAYGSSYKYNVWGDEEITHSSEVTTGPIIAIDDETTDGAYMIYFDGNGTEIIETGIVFGGDLGSSLGGRAASAKTGDVSGQFAASCEGNYSAKGYLIYDDNGTIRVIYTK